MNRRALGPAIVGLAVMALVAFLVVPMLVVGGSALLFAGGSGANCNATVANAQQPAVSAEAANSIPSDYLKWFQRVGLQYNVSVDGPGRHRQGGERRRADHICPA